MNQSSLMISLPIWVPWQYLPRLPSNASVWLFWFQETIWPSRSMSPWPVCIRRSPSDQVVPFLCNNHHPAFENHQPCKTTQTYPSESLEAQVWSLHPRRRSPSRPLRQIQSSSRSVEQGPRILQTLAPQLSCSQTVLPEQQEHELGRSGENR